MDMVPDTLGTAPAWDKRARLSLALLVALALLPFAAVRTFGNVHDDHVLRAHGSLAADLQVPVSTLIGADFFGTPDQPRGHTGYWRPLVLLSFRVEALLAGDSAAGLAWLGHVFTLLCHLASTLALWKLARTVGLGDTGSLLAAAWFAVHPVHVESVGWASGRTDSLPTALGFLGLAVWLREPARRGATALLACALVLALLCKETAILWVLLAPLLGRCAGRSWRAALTPGAAGLTTYVALRAVLFGGLERASEQAYMGPADLADRWLSWLSIQADLVRLTLWPGPATPLHPVAEATGLGSPGVLVGLLVLLLVVYAALLAWRRRFLPGVLASGLVAGTLFMLAPWVAVPTGYPEVAAPLFERYLYAASAAPALLLGWTLGPWAARSRVRLAALILALGLGLGSVSAERVGMWASDETFARAGLAVAPESASLWLHLGMAQLEHCRAGQGVQACQDALQAFDRAVALAPHFRLPAMNRLVALASLGQSTEADRTATELLQRWPGDPAVLHNVAAWYAGSGRLQAAVELYERELATGAALQGAAEALAACQSALR